MKVEMIGPPDPRDAAYDGLVAQCNAVLAHLYSIVPGYQVTLILRNATPIEAPDVVLSNGTDMRNELNLLVTYHNRVNALPEEADNRSRSH